MCERKSNTLMALHNDLDPLPEKRVNKIKNSNNPLPKIKIIVPGLISKLANAIFLLGRHVRSKATSFVHTCSTGKRTALSFFVSIKPYLSHLSIFAVALIAILSNLIVKYARADYSLSYPEPANEIAFAAMVDEFTPLISQDGSAAENAYQNSGGAFVAINSSIDTNITQREEPLPDNSAATINYVVQNGDTLTSLGWKFEVKLATLMYVNNLDNANLVKVGLKLKIPPRGYEVSAAALAKREKEKQLASASRTTITRSSSGSRTSSYVSYTGGRYNNGYAFGYCTWYAASKLPVPAGWGNANRWSREAANDGYSVGKRAVTGSVAVTGESRWGHVAVVESVSGGMVTISEMNAVGWNRVSYRTLPESYFKTFIYVN